MPSQPVHSMKAISCSSDGQTNKGKININFRTKCKLNLQYPCSTFGPSSSFTNPWLSPSSSIIFIVYHGYDETWILFLAEAERGIQAFENKCSFVSPTGSTRPMNMCGTKSKISCYDRNLSSQYGVCHAKNRLSQIIIWFKAFTSWSLAKRRNYIIKTPKLTQVNRYGVSQLNPMMQ